MGRQLRQIWRRKIFRPISCRLVKTVGKLAQKVNLLADARLLMRQHLMLSSRLTDRSNLSIDSSLGTR